MSKIITNANKCGRAIELDSPNVLDITDVNELIEALGEQIVVNKVVAQLTVDFRSKIRGMLEATNEDGSEKYSDESIMDLDFSDWVPEVRTKKTVADKASELFADMTPEQIQEALSAAGIV